MVDHQEDHRFDDGHDERPGTPITGWSTLGY
jgi:hypothetical protein